MPDQHPLIPAIYDGWHTYQTELIKALAPLTGEQLRLTSSDEMRSVGAIATHIVKTRAGWFYFDLEEQDSTFKEILDWQADDPRSRTAAELVTGLETTWAIMQTIIAGWTADQWAKTFTAEDDYGKWEFSRAWVIWHLIEHDLHHGGELSITLGAHGLKGVQL